MGNTITGENLGEHVMAVQERESFGMWHVTVIPANRSKNEDAPGDETAGDGDVDETDRSFEPAIPRHR